MALTGRTLSLVATLLATVVGGCGGDETAPPTSTGGSGGDGGGGGGGGSTPDGPGAVLICPPGELWQDGAGCLAPGLPSDGCGSGFTHDGDAGCEPVLPTAACGPGELAVPGDSFCRPVGDCVGGTWGAIPTDGATQHVNGSYQGTSTGSASEPWTTIQAGVDAAAPGAIVAVAAGSYAEDVVIAQGVTLWGACPADVTLAGSVSGAALTVLDGAATVVVRDLAITGQGAGIVASGPDDLLVERVWIHDTGQAGIVASPGAGLANVVVRDSLIDQATSLGVSIHGLSGLLDRCVVRATQPQGGSDAGVGVYPDVASPGELTLRQSVIEGSSGVGALAQAATLIVEDSVVRNTEPRLDLQRGWAVWAAAADLERATVTVQGSVIESAYEYGIRFDDSDGVVERSVIRDVLPRQSDQLNGVGLRMFGSDPAFLTRPQGRVEQSLIERVYDVGLQGSGVEFAITALVVRDVEPRANDGIRGRGINFRYAAGETERRSAATIAGCRVERSHEVGILVVGSDVDIDSCAVLDTRPRLLDGLLGFGVSYSRNIPVTSEGATGTLVRSLVEEARGAGVVVLASELSATDVVVRDTLRQVESDDFGDGLAASSSLIIAAGHFPTNFDITRATVERSARAGLATFAAPMEVGDTLIDCNPIDMNGEEDAGEPFNLQDRGNNLCGCAADGDEHLCRVLSAGLQPPVAL